MTSLNLPALSTQELWEKQVDAQEASVDAYLKEEQAKPPRTEEFLSWTEELGIREMWEIQPEFLHSDLRTLTLKSDAMRRACNVFSSASKRTAMMLMTVQNFDDEEIADAFAQHFSTELNEGILSLCRKYFFDTSQMRPTDWHNLLNVLPEEQRDKLALVSQPQTKEFIEYSVGKLPRLTYEEILHDIMVSSYYKFKSLADQPLMDTMAQRWATLAMQAGEKKVKFTKGDRTDVGEDIQMRFDFDEPQFPTFPELVAAQKDE